MVKSRSVRAAGKNGRAAAHLRYIQRDGTSRGGERGRLYSATQDWTDGDAFLDRGKDDRHQFRVIISPEDGAELGDLFGFTLASGRFAMIEDGLGFQLVPWQPVLDKRIGQHISGVMRDSGGIEWGFGGKRGLGL
jgi:hypothetical protein